MKKTTLALAALLVAGIGGTIVAFDSPQTDQQTQPQRGNRGAHAQKLQEQIQTAIANGNLSADQRARLEQSQATLRAAAETRKNGGQVDRQQVQQAMGDMRSILQSDAIRPEDRTAIEQTMKEMRGNGKGKRGKGRRGQGKRGQQPPV